MRQTDGMGRKCFICVLYLMLFWFFDKLAEGYRLSAGEDALTKALGALAMFGSTMEKRPLPSFFPRDVLAGGIGAMMVRVGVWIKSKNAKKFRTGIEYGSARWSA